MITKVIKSPEPEEETFDDTIDLLDQGEDINDLINYRISRMNVTYDKESELIIGIQLTFTNLKTKELIPIIRRVFVICCDNEM